MIALLELSRIGRGEMKRESVDLSKIGAEIVTMLGETGPARLV